MYSKSNAAKRRFQSIPCVYVEEQIFRAGELFCPLPWNWQEDEQYSQGSAPRPKRCKFASSVHVFPDLAHTKEEQVGGQQQVVHEERKAFTVVGGPQEHGICLAAAAARGGVLLLLPAQADRRCSADHADSFQLLQLQNTYPNCYDLPESGST